MYCINLKLRIHWISTFHYDSFWSSEVKQIYIIFEMIKLFYWKYFHFIRFDSSCNHISHSQKRKIIEWKEKSYESQKTFIWANAIILFFILSHLNAYNFINSLLLIFSIVAKYVTVKDICIPSILYCLI